MAQSNHYRPIRPGGPAFVTGAPWTVGAEVPGLRVCP